MKRICAWCTKDLGVVANSPHPDTVISHGICEECVANFSFQNGVSCQDYIDSFMLPILAIAVHADTYLITRSVNKKACEFLGKEAGEMVQHLAGNVFECAHARLPEGCGRTIHCSGCVIRRSVLLTYSTGIPQVEVPATIKRSASAADDRVDLSVTTVKAGDLVVLRIDHVHAEGYDHDDPSASCPGRSRSGDDSSLSARSS